MAKYFPLEEYHRRWSGVLREMKSRGFETAVIFSRGGGTTDNCGDVLYLTNHYAVSGGLDSLIWSARSFAGVVMREGHEPQLHMDEPVARPDILATTDVRSHRHPFAGVASELAAQGVKGKVALVGTQFVPLKYYRQLVEHAPDIEWVEADDLVRSVRMYKSPRELDSYRIGGEAATASMNILMEGLLGGKSEQEAAGDAAREVVRRGGRIQVIGVNHGDTIGFGQRNPLTGYSADTPKQGDIVKGSIHAAFHQGYYLDPGRTAVVGRPAADQRRLIEATAGIVGALSDMMRPGVSLLDVAAKGDRMTAEFDGDVSPSMKSFPFYGHGVGLAFELPRISTSMSLPTDTVGENMVFGVEAFLSLGKAGSAFFEDIIIIGKDGNELLTRTPNYWW